MKRRPEDLAEYSQYVDPQYAEKIMQESLMLGDTRRRTPAARARASETDRARTRRGSDQQV